MIPILYSSTATSLNNNGIGRLADCLSCTVTEERNGDYTLELRYPTTGKWFSHIALDSIIGAKPNRQTDVEHFRVISIVAESMDVIAVQARQVALEAMRDNVYLGRAGPEFGYTNLGQAADWLWKYATTLTDREPGSHTPSRFPTMTFYSDVNAADSFNLPPLDAAIPFNTVLVGNEGSLIDKCGGELKYHDYTVSILRSRGSDNGVKLSYGKNIIGIQQTSDFSEVFDGYVPYITLSEPWEYNQIVAFLTTYPYQNIIIWSPYRDLYSHNRIKPLDVSSIAVYDASSYDNVDYEKTYAAAVNWVNQHPEWGLPEVTTTVQFVPLGQTEEYKHLENFEALDLCDTVSIYFPTLDVNKQAKVVKTVYNTLREKYDSIEIGTLKQTLAQTIKSIKKGR